MAQQRGNTAQDPEQMAEKQTAHMVKSLSLDDQQAAKIKAINLEFAQKSQAARAELQGDREAMKASRQELQNSKNEALQGVLTQEQFEKYTQMQENKGKKQGKQGKKARKQSKKGADDSK